MRSEVLWPHGLSTRNLEATLAVLRDVKEEAYKTDVVTPKYCLACKTGMREHLT